MSSKDKAEAPAPLPGGGQAPAAGGKKKGLIIGIAVAVLVLAGGGGAAYWKFVLSAHAEDAAADGHGSKASSSHGDEGDDEGTSKKKKKKGDMPEDPGMVAFEPFLVNLADEGAQSYLRVTLSLLVESEEEAKALEAKTVLLTRIRSALLEVLSTQTAEHLSTPEGKSELKDLVKEKIESLELEIEVYDVLFSDFVVQY